MVRAMVCVVVIALSACDDPPCKCTTEFQVKLIVVTDSAGQPASGLTTKTTRNRDQTEITPTSYFPTDVGQYIVIDDSDRGDLDVEPTAITFFASGPSGSGTVDGQASVDSCDCHVVYQGPQMLVLGPAVD